MKTQLKGVIIVISLTYNKLKIMLCYGVFILFDCLLYDHCKSHIMYNRTRFRMKRTAYVRDGYYTGQSYSVAHSLF